MKMEQPKFIKDFSKQESSEERTQLAHEIREKRTKYFEDKKYIEAKEQEKSETVKQLEALKNQIETYNDASFFVKIKDFFAIKKIERELQSQLGKQASIEEELNKSISGRQDLDETKTMVSEFYKRQKEKWAKSEYTNEDIKENFTEEHLASLSIEDYATLLQRFPQEMVAHVTRQGVRDHTGHVYHTSGEGAYANGFSKIVEDGRLRSPLGVHLIEDEKEKAVANFLHLDKFKSKSDAIEFHKDLFDPNNEGPGSYADRMSIHFASEEVADVYYGSEKGNEIFIAYPSAHVASQHHFNGQLAESSGSYWNDQWVWANEEQGMDLNAGLIFIPEDAKVDKDSGSRYELDNNKMPIENMEYRDTLNKVISSPDFNDFAKKVMEITGKFKNPNEKTQSKQLEPFRLELIQKFNITDSRLQSAIFDYKNLFTITCNIDDREKVEETISNALKEEGVFFQEAKNTITSKEYWENNFSKNLIKRPSKIVYYSGGNPTKALWEWQKKHGISKKAKSANLGFSENQVKRTSPEAMYGSERFRSLAEKVMDDYYENKNIE